MKNKDSRRKYFTLRIPTAVENDSNPLQLIWKSHTHSVPTETVPSPEARSRPDHRVGTHGPKTKSWTSDPYGTFYEQHLYLKSALFQTVGGEFTVHCFST